jgi:hypothetical protein
VSMRGAKDKRAQNEQVESSRENVTRVRWSVLGHKVAPLE